MTIRRKHVDGAREVPMLPLPHNLRDVLRGRPRMFFRLAQKLGTKIKADDWPRPRWTRIPMLTGHATFLRRDGAVHHRVEHDFADLENVLDQIGAEEPPDRWWCILDGCSDALAKQPELGCGDFGEQTPDGVVAGEVIVDAVSIVLEETIEVHP